MRGRARALVVAALLAAGQLVAVGWPAHACGCGAMVTADDKALSVTEETSVIRWDGARQDIVMRLSVEGDAPEAAWVMPVPGRAEVTLGERELFTELQRLTAPRLETRYYFWPREGDWPFSEDGDGAVAGGGEAMDGSPGVEVVGREQLGPFDVARLAATDPEALDGWLGENGFGLSERLADELTHYVEQSWEYVAIRLAPDAAADDADAADGADADAAGEDSVLGGDLDPLHLSFESDTLVYPMRLSRLAQNPQELRLYVLAPHRMEPLGDIGGQPPEVVFAGRLAPGDQPAGAVRELADGDQFLTVLDQSFHRPEEIDADHELVRTARDDEYHQVIHRDELLHWAGMPAWLVTVGGTTLLLAAGGGWLLIRRRRTPVGPPEGVPAGPPPPPPGPPGAAPAGG